MMLYIKIAKRITLQGIGENNILIIRSPLYLLDMSSIKGNRVMNQVMGISVLVYQFNQLSVTTLPKADRIFLIDNLVVYIIINYGLSVYLKFQWSFGIGFYDFLVDFRIKKYTTVRTAVMFSVLGKHNAHFLGRLIILSLSQNLSVISRNIKAQVGGL